MQLENNLDACVTEVAPPPPAPDPEELAAQHKRHWTPLGLAEWLIITFGWLFRYIAETGMWIVWGEGRWHQDTASIGMFQLCKATLRYMAQHPNVDPDLLKEFKSWVRSCETEPMFLGDHLKTGHQ
jgi:hypothetical protein